MQKGTRVIQAKGTDGSDIEGESDSTESSPDSDPFNRADERSGDEPSSGEDGSDLRSASEVELVSGKKIPSIRKPSKRAIETALNEVS